MPVSLSRLARLIMATGLLVGCLAVPARPNPIQDNNQASVTQLSLTEEEMAQFLRTAKVIREKPTKKGVTNPYRLTLNDGRFTHDAGFQPIDERRSIAQMQNGSMEVNFRDSYHFNIAAYEIGKLLGLERMMPVTVERSHNGKKGSLTWWLPVKMDESDRLKNKIAPPDVAAWNRQMYRKLVFAQLIYDTDPNPANTLIGENWEIYMIDFTRAFRLQEDLQNPKDLVRCDRQLMEKLRQLNQAEIEKVTKPHLDKAEVKALVKRRDKIVAHFERLIAEKGEDSVLY